MSNESTGDGVWGTPRLLSGQARGGEFEILFLRFGIWILGFVSNLGGWDLQLN